MMHPAMAVWIWSMAMARAWQPSQWYGNWLIPESDNADKRNILIRASTVEPRLVLANDYLHSGISENPLPDTLMDRLADLYWTERDEELAI